MKGRKLKASIVLVKELNLPERFRMFNIYEKYYENAKREKFELDLMNKDKVILLRNQDNHQIEGFQL